MRTVQFNLEAALQTNGVTESDVKEVIKKQLDNTPKCKDDKNANDANYKINTTNAVLVELKWEKVITLRLLLTPRAWRVALVCPHSISVFLMSNYSNMAATSHMKLPFLTSKVSFLLNLDIVMKKKLVLYQPLLRK